MNAIPRDLAGLSGGADQGVDSGRPEWMKELTEFKKLDAEYCRGENRLMRGVATPEEAAAHEARVERLTELATILVANKEAYRYAFAHDGDRLSYHAYGRDELPSLWDEGVVHTRAKDRELEL